jgi:hypothetical protein
MPRNINGVNIVDTEGIRSALVIAGFFRLPTKLANSIARDVLQCPAMGGLTAVRPPLMTIALVLGATFPALAQTTATPDFSGSWVLNAAKSTLAKDNKIKSETIAINYKKSTIVFRYKTDGKKATETYTPDGQQRVTRDMSSSQLISKATWQDSALVIESVLQIKIPNVVVNVSGLKPVIDRWTLGPDGRTLSHETDDPKQILVYNKQ